jgi:hypothetical protein
MSGFGRTLLKKSLVEKGESSLIHAGLEHGLPVLLDQHHLAFKYARKLSFSEPLNALHRAVQIDRRVMASSPVEAGTESMMGPRQVEQGALFYNFSSMRMYSGLFTEVDRPPC